ncbi:hypothetical protein RLIN73S_06520 [Rhodanobacter lindaniclasticus]
MPTESFLPNTKYASNSTLPHTESHQNASGITTRLYLRV